MNKRKSLAEQANRFMNDMTEDFISAPQPNTTFDPFAPNYGDTQKTTKLPMVDKNKPMETDIDEPESSDKDNVDSGNQSHISKMYMEISEVFKDVIVKSKNIDKKLEALSNSVETASEEKLASMDGVSKQLYEDVEQFNGIIKSILEIIDDIDDEESEVKKEPEGNSVEDQEEEEDGTGETETEE